MQINFNINIDDRIINFLKSVFRKKRAVMVISLIFFTGIAVFATTAWDSWEELQAGDPISATGLNEKFNTVKNAIDAVGGTDADGTYVWEKVDGNLKKVYTEHFTGITPDAPIFTVDNSRNWLNTKVLTASMKIRNKQYGHTYLNIWDHSDNVLLRILYTSGEIQMKLDHRYWKTEPYTVTIRWYKD